MVLRELLDNQEKKKSVAVWRCKLSALGQMQVVDPRINLGWLCGAEMSLGRYRDWDDLGSNDTMQLERNGKGK